MSAWFQSSSAYCSLYLYLLSPFFLLVSRVNVLKQLNLSIQRVNPENVTLFVLFFVLVFLPDFTFAFNVSLINEKLYLRDRHAHSMETLSRINHTTIERKSDKGSIYNRKTYIANVTTGYIVYEEQAFWLMLLVKSETPWLHPLWISSDLIREVGKFIVIDYRGSYNRCYKRTQSSFAQPTVFCFFFISNLGISRTFLKCLPHIRF